MPIETEDIYLGFPDVMSDFTTLGSSSFKSSKIYSNSTRSSVDEAPSMFRAMDFEDDPITALMMSSCHPEEPVFDFGIDDTAVTTDQGQQACDLASDDYLFENGSSYTHVSLSVVERIGEGTSLDNSFDGSFSTNSFETTPEEQKPFVENTCFSHTHFHEEHSSSPDANSVHFSDSASDAKCAHFSTEHVLALQSFNPTRDSNSKRRHEPFEITIKEDMSCLVGSQEEQMAQLKRVKSIVKANGRDFLEIARTDFSRFYTRFCKAYFPDGFREIDEIPGQPNPVIDHFIDAFYGDAFGMNQDVYFKPLRAYTPEAQRMVHRKLIGFLPRPDHNGHQCGLHCVRQTCKKTISKDSQKASQQYVVNVFPPLLYFQTPNHISIKESVEDDEFVYMPYVSPNREETAYTPKVVRRSLNQATVAQVGNEALCPICTEPGYYSMNGSNYFHHMKTQHGIFSKGEIMLQPLYYGKHPSKKTKRSECDQFRNMGICPLCLLDSPNRPSTYLFEINPWAGTGNNPYLNYLRHCEKKHQIRIRKT